MISLRFCPLYQNTHFSECTPLEHGSCAENAVLMNQGVNYTEDTLLAR